MFNKLDQLLSQAATDKSLDSKLRQDKVILFLHLLGVDSAGHAYKPPNEGYFETIRHVDKQLEQAVQKLDQFFNDDKTTYIFTGDHGMSSIGSHGDGNPECTRTPLVLWGNSVRESTSGTGNIIGDDGSMTREEEENYVFSRWKLDPAHRKDIRQADLAPAMVRTCFFSSSR